MLGVARYASFQQIQDAYWKLAYRSDRGESLAQLNEAYEVLGDDERRRRYDAGPGPGPSNAG